VTTNPPYPSELGADRAPGETVPRDDTSIGALIGDITTDLSRLMRQEVELAKAEVKEEAGKA